MTWSETSFIVNRRASRKAPSSRGAQFGCVELTSVRADDRRDQIYADYRYINKNIATEGSNAIVPFDVGKRDAQKRGSAGLAYSPSVPAVALL